MSKRGNGKRVLGDVYIALPKMYSFQSGLKCCEAHLNVIVLVKPDNR